MLISKEDREILSNLPQVLTFPQVSQGEVHLFCLGGFGSIFLGFLLLLFFYTGAKEMTVGTFPFSIPIQVV